MLYFSKHHLIWKSLIALIPCLMYTDDCEWSAWEYGKCSASCGTGTQEIRRSYRSIHGERCGVADQVEARPCKYPDCPGISPLMILVSFQNLNIGQLKLPMIFNADHLQSTVNGVHGRCLVYAPKHVEKV